MNICTNIQYLINSGDDCLVSLTEQPVYSCENICGQYTPVYGLCQIDLVNSYFNNVNKTKYCVYPFIFNDYECICAQGYLLNGTICINILSTLTNLDQYIFDNFSTLNSNLQNNILNIKNQLITTKDDLYNYFTNKISNYSQYVNSKFDDLYNKHNQFELFVSQNFSSLQNETNNLQSNITMHKIISDQLRVDLQSLNSTLGSQIQLFKSDVIYNNTQLNTKIQNIIATANSQKLVTDSIKTDLTQSTNSLQDQINNINAVNNAQNEEIILLKNQLASMSDQSAVQTVG
ncbi:Hypothetical_protein [Hexamita inflata]|uniref:Hypothetical_protein n=1 Tax=Hexamita inflata TaxID=28002 RepID=A0AA86Q3X6_9EUKA|nr:Hypothetical protein HINF_LOCUS39201 [Hexamita inflata]